ncbi:MAG: hypothetical protein A3J48_01720 [Candidatus Doudnabacteria bacterium RIFCSPHIGHO2_02_FULL_46_11]|uniref:Dephospho-CoA kinase n=1 Tax=Candidatus Doudnabacteria bacterium RIFCSPHIGHO2_02_FULL_46_11 TaxID=1817832 RepID=A0A1F5P9K2_9BACT|nr:MAG: hypothetical protein A3J48_01720 [Candidatus Doudnabacteria bacterium RIFCSPHIGHO2_02_FULL_46_11]
MDKTVIGLVGLIASGKSDIGKYVSKKYNADYIRFSDILRDILDRISVEYTRQSLVKLSQILRENFGESIFSKAVAGDIKKSKRTIFVVDGIRREGDVEFLKNSSKFYLVWVEADPKIRYQRIISRDDNTDDQHKTFEEFLKDHNLETEQTIIPLKEKADFNIDNNGSLEDLYKQIDEIVKKTS